MLTYNPNLTPSLPLQIPAPKDRVHLTLLAFHPAHQSTDRLARSNGVVPGLCPSLVLPVDHTTPVPSTHIPYMWRSKSGQVPVPLLITAATYRILPPPFQPTIVNSGPGTHRRRRHRRAPIPPDNVPDRSAGPTVYGLLTMPCECRAHSSHQIRKLQPPTPMSMPMAERNTPNQKRKKDPCIHPSLLSMKCRCHAQCIPRSDEI